MVGLYEGGQSDVVCIITYTSIISTYSLGLSDMIGHVSVVVHTITKIIHLKALVI